MQASAGSWSEEPERTYPEQLLWGGMWFILHAKDKLNRLKTDSYRDRGRDGKRDSLLYTGLQKGKIDLEKADIRSQVPHLELPHG